MECVFAFVSADVLFSLSFLILNSLFLVAVASSLEMCFGPLDSVISNVCGIMASMQL